MERPEAERRGPCFDDGVHAAVVRSAHALEPDAVASALEVDVRVGLSQGEARARLAALGPNVLDRPRRPPYLRIAARQLLDPLVALLLVAAIVSASIGEGLEAAVIAAIVVLNALLGFVLEAGAEREVLALQSSLALEATVIREGFETTVPATERSCRSVTTVSRM